MAGPNPLLVTTQVPIQSIQDFVTQRKTWFLEHHPTCNECGNELSWERKAIWEVNITSRHMLIFQTKINIHNLGFMSQQSFFCSFFSGGLNTVF